jgi:hypothetical protein
MADNLLFAVQGTPIPTRDEIEAAANCIGDASFNKIERLLELSAPDNELRARILEAVVVYRSCADVAASERRNLTDIRKYLSGVLEHLQALQEQLPGKGRHDSVKASFLLEVLGQGIKMRRRFVGKDYMTFRALLNDFTRVTQVARVKLKKKRVPPNLRLEGEKWLVRRLAEIFQQRTGRDPRDHVKSNYTKSEYRGTFFEIAEEVLRRLGHQQTNTTRGRMIRRILEDWPKMSRPV